MYNINIYHTINCSIDQLNASYTVITRSNHEQLLGVGTIIELVSSAVAFMDHHCGIEMVLQCNHCVLVGGNH